MNNNLSGAQFPAPVKSMLPGVEPRALNDATTETLPLSSTNSTSYGAKTAWRLPKSPTPPAYSKSTSGSFYNPSG